MGFDCTLHLVDEKAIREEFVPRLLGKSQKETTLDRVVEDAAELWDTVRKALDGDDPEEAASLVCQLAVKFSACLLPHQYERGFALSLCQDGDDAAVEYPGEFAFSPELLFADVVKEYPELHGHFPKWFTGNYCTGVFIPSDRVPEVLAWIEKEIKKLAKGDQREFKGMLRILRGAADKRLAYWEATDLTVPIANEFAGDPNLMMARFLGNEPGTSAQQIEEAPLGGQFNSTWHSVYGDWLVSTYDTPITNFWELAVWPPRLAYSLKEFCSGLAPSRDGRWLLLSATDMQARPRIFRPRLYATLDDKADVFPVLVEGSEASARAGAFVGHHLLAFRDRPGSLVGTVLPGPLLLGEKRGAFSLLASLWSSGKQWRPGPGLPDVVGRASALPLSVDDPVIGVVHLPNGEDVVIWDGDGYEWRGERFEKTFSMSAREREQYWTYAPAGTDGFFYLSKRNLFEIHRQGEPIPHVPKWTNIMYVRRGPAASILLQEGDNKDGDVAKLYFPADGTFIHIEPELFDDNDYPFILWSERADRFIVARNKFFAVPTSVVLALPRYKTTTGRKVKQ